MSTRHNVGDSRFWIVYDMCSVSVANNFVHCQTASDYGYHTFRELARFIHCLLQKIKQGSSLALVEQWDDYVLPNHSKFFPIADGEFLAGTRVLAALNKIGSSYLKREFQRDAHRFLEEFTTSVLSTVVDRLKIGQGLSCFCPAITIGGDDHAPLHLLGLLLDGLLDCVWIKGWIPVLRSGATTAGTVFDDEAPWLRWCPVVLLFTGWFSCSSAFV